MIRVALRGLVQRKLRALLTALAVVLGVAMVSGTLMLTDSIERAFGSIFNDSYAQTDAVVAGRPIVEGASSGNPSVSPDLLPRIRALPGVAAAAGSLADLQGSANTITLVGADGAPVTGTGAQSFGFGVDPSQPRFIPLGLTDGDWPQDGTSLVLDRGTARSQHLGVGDTIGVGVAGGVEQFTVSGLARYGSVDSLGGSAIAVFDLDTAQRVLRKDGYDSISVAAREGTSIDALLAQIEPLLPATAQVTSASARAASDSEEVSEFVDYLRYALLAFGGIALFVGGFVIFNTLSITIAQRTRELATLRTLGASRRQVLRSVLAETVAIGVLASLTGLAAGVALARGLVGLFGALGLGLPHADIALATSTVVVSLLVGTGVTVVAGFAPAVRATRVAPIAAVREGAAPPASRLAPAVPYVSLAILAVAAAATGYGLFAGGAPVQQRLLTIALGTLAGFVGLGLLAPRLVGPLAAVVGWPAARFAGAPGALARRNAVRQPGRTAASAAALMIGLALVTAVAVLGQGLRSSATDTVERQVTADYVVTAANGFDSVPPEIGRQLEGLPGVTASSVRSDQAKVAGSTETVTGIDGDTIGELYAFRFSAGSDAALGALADGGAIVRRTFAEDHGLQVGSPLQLTTPSGVEVDVRVEAVLDQGKFDLDPLLGSVMIDRATFDASFPRPSDLYTFVNLDEQAAGFAGQAIAQGAERFPGAQVSTREEFVSDRTGGITQILNLLYVLLALSVVVSLFGMVNTLVLAVFERTRELGMLRAIGLGRRQTRRTIRHESVITALIGAALGMPLGIALAAAATRALDGYGIQFELPLGTLAAFVLVAVVAGVAAAVLPARRAGRLDVLRALEYE